MKIKATEVIILSFAETSQEMHPYCLLCLKINGKIPQTLLEFHTHVQAEIHISL